MRMKKLIISSLMMLIPLTTLALDKQTQYWGSLSLIKPLDEKWVLSAELINRYSVDNGESFVKSTRLGLGYKFENGLTYTGILEDRRTDQHKNNEKRYMHQLSKKWKFEPLDLSLRFRQEHRKFENSEAIMNRSGLKMQLDITKWAMGPVTPFYSSEYTILTNTVEGRQAGTGESRNNIGATWKASDALSLDLAYMDRRTYTPQTSLKRRTEVLFQAAVLGVKYGF